MIIASAAGKDFIQKDLPTHSLCRYVGMKTPTYSVSHWAEDVQHFRWPRNVPTVPVQDASNPSLRTLSADPGITILQTPGHTPDELAWYDHGERHLYVGDTLYERGADDMPIIFPRDGNWIQYMASLHKLLEFVRDKNAILFSPPAPLPSPSDEECDQSDADNEDWQVVLPRVKVGCAHQTASVDGEEILEEVIALFERIIEGKVPVVNSREIRGEVYDSWKEDGEVKFSVRAPRRLCEEARKHFERWG
ncbi:hypothetical protein H2203_006838 [Taxawa tesnikishii (nom. ined.)]|nr:hypothetical protein H2203_006838 [Dothideales sp. JES 119]